MASLISIVMPCFRHEAYVAEAVRSVLAQTHEDWELIAIDDASPDRTFDVLRAFDDPRIRASRHAVNRGAHATINEGVRVARGELITILNSDDAYRPTRLASLLAFRERTGADVVSTDVTLVDAGGEPLPPSHYVRSWFEGLKQNLATHGSVRRVLLNGNVFMTTSNLLFTSKAFEHVGLFEPLRYTHDYEWLFRAVSKDRKIAFDADSASLDYRFHGSNTILEAPLAANQETLDLLLRYETLVLAEGSREACEEHAAHVRKIVRQIEHEIRQSTAAPRAAGGLRSLLRRVVKR